MRSWSALKTLASVSILLLSFSGCDNSVTMVNVSGSVTLDSDPLPDGLITIFPIKGGKPNSGQITDGKYELDVEPGTYKVEISRLVSTGAPVTDPDYGIESEQRESIPSRYNSQSELRMEVTANDSTEFDYPLSSE